MAGSYSLGQIHRRIKMLKLHIKFCKVPIQHSFFLQIINIIVSILSFKVNFLAVACHSTNPN